MTSNNHTQDTLWHPLWCTAEDCEIPTGEALHTGPATQFVRKDGRDFDDVDVRVRLAQMQEQDGSTSRVFVDLHIDDVLVTALDIVSLNAVIGMLTGAREQVMATGEAYK